MILLSSPMSALRSSVFKIKLGLRFTVKYLQRAIGPKPNSESRSRKQNSVNVMVSDVAEGNVLRHLTG